MKNVRQILAGNVLRNDETPTVRHHAKVIDWYDSLMIELRQRSRFHQIHQPVDVVANAFKMGNLDCHESTEFGVVCQINRAESSKAKSACNRIPADF